MTKLPDPAASFPDVHGRPWRLVLTPDAVARVKAETGLDLEAVAHQPDGRGYLDLLRLMCGGDQLGEVLWVLCQTSAAARGVGRQDFAAAVGAYAIVADPDLDPNTCRRGADSQGYAGAALIRATAARWPDSPLAAVIVRRRHP